MAGGRRYERAGLRISCIYSDAHQPSIASSGKFLLIVSSSRNTAFQSDTHDVYLSLLGDVMLHTVSGVSPRSLGGQQTCPSQDGVDLIFLLCIASSTELLSEVCVCVLEQHFLCKAGLQVCLSH